jgi:hypothetical protein
MKEINVRAIRIFLVVLSICAFSAHVCFGGVLSNALSEWDPDAINGKIMKVGTDYIIVNEDMIILVDTSFKGEKCKSSIMDLSGNSNNQNELAVGRYVFVKGSWAIDKKKKHNVFVAKEIYLLPNGMNEKQLKDNPLFLSPTEPW